MHSQVTRDFKVLAMLRISTLQGLLYIVTEFAAGGTLYSLVNQAKGPLPEDVIWRLFIQVWCIAPDYTVATFRDQPNTVLAAAGHHWAEPHA